jgi:lipopolysaccharide transport system permease protein
VVRHRELLGNFVRRELAAQFQGTLLGRFWPVLQPLALIAVYYVVFVEVIGARFAEAGLQGLEAFYIAAGILPWIAFADGLHRSCTVVVDHGNLIKKVAFPSELLPLEVVLVQVVKEVVGLVVLVIAIALAAGRFPNPAVAWLPLALLLQVLFTLGLAYLVSAMQVFVRDTAPTLGLLTLIWMFLTPIFYAIEHVPPRYRPWYDWNPMARLVSVYRDMFVRPGSPDPSRDLAAFAVAAIVSFVLGFLFFARSRDRFADEV